MAKANNISEMAQFRESVSYQFIEKGVKPPEPESELEKKLHLQWKQGVLKLQDIK